MTHNDSLPLQPGTLHRPRVHSLLEEGLTHPLLILLAGPGYGKTQAMASYMGQSDAKFIWFRLNNLDNLHSHFWERLVRTLIQDFPRATQRLEALSFPDTRLKFDAFFRILAEEMPANERVVWVFDDAGEVNNRRVRNFFRWLADLSLPGFSLVMISNQLNTTDSIAFIGGKRFLILGKDLRFVPDEIDALYQMHGIALAPDELQNIAHYTEGWPLLLHLLVMHDGQIPDSTQPDGNISHQTITHLFEERFFSTYPKQLQKLLVQLSLPHAFTYSFAAELYQGGKADLEILESHAFINQDPSGHLLFHFSYRTFLEKKKYLLTAEAERATWEKAAAYYAASDNMIEAITCYRKAGNHPAMLETIATHIPSQYGTTAEEAAFYLEHLALLSDEEVQAYPVADYLRALICLNTLALEESEAILLALEKRLMGLTSADMHILLGEVYVSLGAIHMMRNQEDFGDYYKKAAGYLPNGTRLHTKHRLQTQNQHNFSMADSLPGAKERMERAVHYGIPYMSTVLRGGMSGMEHIFSTEAAYLSFQLDDAQQHAYRTIYKAEAHAQHDLVCNGHCLLARIGFLRGDFAEMTRQVDNIVQYAAKHNISVLDEIRDTALAWYYIKLHDYKRMPASMMPTSHSNKPVLSYGRSQIVYANYLLNTGEYAQVIGMLEYPKGLYFTRGIWPDRICLYIILAIAYHQLQKPDAAMKALWTAYDMAYANGLTTLFIEAERYMPALMDTARKQDVYAFDPAWLDLIAQQAADFAGRASAVRAAYQKQSPEPTASRDNPLTKRELEVLYALSRGLTREEIAIEQYVSVNTVKTFIRNIYNRLNAANRAEAVSIAISLGYIEALPPRPYLDVRRRNDDESESTVAIVVPIRV